MRRIVVVGPGGSGKSTLARQVGSALCLEVVHLDSVFWKPGWVRVPAGEQQELLNEIVARPEWVIDGDHIRTQEFRFAAADTILFLDFPRPVCLRRTVLRFFRNRGSNRLGLPIGCPERLSWALLRWVWRYPQDNRALVLAGIERHAAGKRVIVLHGPREVEQFVAGLGASR